MFGTIGPELGSLELVHGHFLFIIDERLSVPVVAQTIKRLNIKKTKRIEKDEGKKWKKGK